jgi:aryl-alcohol dehydrogenase-like predicted oxidoreductase
MSVSEIGFGGWAVGGTADAGGTPMGWGRSNDDESLAAIRRARDLGVTFFDTADSYGFGRSESLLGIVLSRHRQDVVIATKVGVARDANGRLRKDFSSTSSTPSTALSNDSGPITSISISFTIRHSTSSAETTFMRRWTACRKPARSASGAFP